MKQELSLAVYVCKDKYEKIFYMFRKCNKTVTYSNKYDLILFLLSERWDTTAKDEFRVELPLNNWLVLCTLTNLQISNPNPFIF